MTQTGEITLNTMRGIIKILINKPSRHIISATET